MLQQSNKLITDLIFKQVLHIQHILSGSLLIPERTDSKCFLFVNVLKSHLVWQSMNKIVKKSKEGRKSVS